MKICTTKEKAVPLRAKRNINMTRIAFFGTKKYDQETFDSVNASLNEQGEVRYGFDIKYFKAHPNMDNVLLVQGVEVVCCFVNDTLSADVITEMGRLGVKLIALRCAGFNNVDIAAAQKVGIRVVRVPAYSPHAIAEFTLGLILALNRHLPRAAARTRDGNFSLQGLMGFDLYGKTIGIIGTGKIAKVLIQILQGFGMRILGNDLYPDEAFAAQHNMQYVPLDTLLRESDIISLHCPLTHDNHHLINADTIAITKKGVMIINTGRGGLIDTEALIDGLKSRHIGSAGLDVYEEEGGYFYEDVSDAIIEDDVLARLLSFNNVLLTSHQAFFTKEALTNIATTTLQNVRDYLDGKPLTNEVL